MYKFLLCVLASCQMLASGEIFQVSTFGALKNGVLNGDYTLKQLKMKGDFGIGVCNHLDGQWVAFKGKFYKTNKDMAVEEVKASEKIPFGVVTFFKAPVRFTLNNVHSSNDLEQKLPQLIKNKNLPHAILIEGNFQILELQNFRMQSPPYTSLSAAKKDQYNLQNQRGMLIGYWFPSYMNEFNLAGAHFHWLSRDRGQCGQVVEVKFKTAKVAVQEASNLDIYFPKLQTFSNARISEMSTTSGSGS